MPAVRNSATNHKLVPKLISRTATTAPDHPRRAAGPHLPTPGASASRWNAARSTPWRSPPAARRGVVQRKPAICCVRSRSACRPMFASCRVKSDLDFILQEARCRYGNTTPDFRRIAQNKQPPPSRIARWGGCWLCAVPGNFDDAMAMLSCLPGACAPALLERNVTKRVTYAEDYKSRSPVGQTVLRVPTEDFAFPCVKT